MYTLVTFVLGQHAAIMPGLTLIQAYRHLHRIGRGAIFRGTPDHYAKPVYPRLSQARHVH